jgi:hypothetical protein
MKKNKEKKQLKKIKQKAKEKEKNCLKKKAKGKKKKDGLAFHCGLHSKKLIKKKTRKKNPS